MTKKPKQIEPEIQDILDVMMIVPEIVTFVKTGNFSFFIDKTNDGKIRLIYSDAFLKALTDKADA